RRGPGQRQARRREPSARLCAPGRGELEAVGRSGSGARERSMGFAIVWLVGKAVQLMIWFIIAAAILSWLVAFDVVNLRNRFVYQVARFLEAATEPLLAPFRRIIPSLGGIDVSPIVVILLLQFALVLFDRMAAPA